MVFLPYTYHIPLYAPEPRLLQKSPWKQGHMKGKFLAVPCAAADSQQLATVALQTSWLLVSVTSVLDQVGTFVPLCMQCKKTFALPPRRQVGGLGPSLRSNHFHGYFLTLCRSAVCRQYGLFPSDLSQSDSATTVHWRVAP